MIDVLFVDDELELARDLSGLIRDDLKVRVAAADDPDEVLLLVRDVGVKVAVLDQKMPRPGVELGRQIAKIDPRVRRILLSGEATSGQVTEAYDEKFDRHIHKNDALALLPLALRRALVQYDTELHRELQGDSPWSSNVLLGWLPRRPRIRLKLLSIDSRDEAFVFENSWQTRARVDAGQQIKETTTLVWERSNHISYESTLSQSLSTKLGLGTGKTAKAEAALKTEIVQKSGVQQADRNQRTITLETTLSLNPETQAPSTVVHLARAYEVAPVYVRFNVSIAAQCCCCEVSEVIKASYFAGTSKRATRQINYFSDNSRTEAHTGIEVS